MSALGAAHLDRHGPLREEEIVGEVDDARATEAEALPHPEARPKEFVAEESGDVVHENLVDSAHGRVGRQGETARPAEGVYEPVSGGRLR